MRIPFLRSLAAALAILFIASACAGDTGAQWTYAPVAVSDVETPSASSAPPESMAPHGSMAPVESAGPSGSPPAPGSPGPDGSPPPDGSAPPDGSPPPDPSGGPRVIKITAEASLQFSQDGQKVTDIAVTPGETIVFQVENTAGFDHNFYIGTEEQLVAPGGTTDVGIPAFSSGIQELRWVVPDDIAGLKFGCTVPGHYTLMQGTFSLSP